MLQVEINIRMLLRYLCCITW